ncbi:hypothetical protein WA588_001753 [Blastocystis sp. NMH]
MRENVLYCDKCFKTVTAVKCSECGSLIKGKNRVEAMGQFYHPRHFVCFNCKCQLVKPLFVKKMVSVNGVCSNYGFCPDCANKLNNTICSECCQTLDDKLVYENGSYVHADCSSAEGERKPSNLPISVSTSSAEEEKQVNDHVAPLSEAVEPQSIAVEPIAPTKLQSIPMSAKSVSGTTAPLRPSYRPSQYHAAHLVRPEDVVSSEPLSHMAGFDTVGSVVKRSEAFGKEEDLPVPKKQFDDPQFVSQGAIQERVQTFGTKETPVEESEKKFDDPDFVSQGAIQERVQAFGRKEMPVEEPAKKLNDPDFVSQGSMADRVKAFGKKEDIPVPEESAKKLDDADFVSQGSMADRVKAFGKKEDIPVPEESAKKLDDADFVSQGSMADRVKAFGKKENLPVPEEPKEDPDFIPQGSMAERMKAFENQSEEPKEA